VVAAQRKDGRRADGYAKTAPGAVFRIENQPAVYHLQAFIRTGVDASAAFAVGIPNRNARFIYYGNRHFKSGRGSFLTAVHCIPRFFHCGVRSFYITLS
jgi:hypothetical protein